MLSPDEVRVGTVAPHRLLATHCVAPGRRPERASAEAEGARLAWGVIRARLPGRAPFAPAHGQAGARGFVDGQIREVSAVRACLMGER